MPNDSKHSSEFKAWHKDQIAQYAAEHEAYEKYANTLRVILEKAAKLYAPEAIVQVRAKAVPSFAEKVLRKADKYSDPVHQLTDLCGGRVITHTQADVDRIGAFIRRNFIIDEANSVDVRTRLRVSEFGYLSIHYIVQFKDDELLGVSIPAETQGKKAEIQVRTLLQHVWASTVHDRLYKGGFEAPEMFHREAARLAAVMENADGAFACFAEGLDAYRLNHSAYMSHAKMLEEMATLTMIMENERIEANKPPVAIRMARIARAGGDWTTVIRSLEPFAGFNGPERPEILLELGNALCRQFNGNRDEIERFYQGQKYLKEVAKPEDGVCRAEDAIRKMNEKLRAQALSYLAWSYSELPKEERKARDLYQIAYQCDPANPYLLSSYLEYDIYCRRDKSYLPILRQTLQTAIETCRSHAEAGIELPQAYYTMGRLYLLMELPYESLSAYAKAVQLCISGKAFVSADVFDTELEFLRRIDCMQESPETHGWIERLILLGKNCMLSPDQPLPELAALASRQCSFSAPVLIIAGGTDVQFKEELQKYREYLYDAMDGLQGTVVSGGTISGIPGLAGEASDRLKGEGHKCFTLLGYLPQFIPADTMEDKRYDQLICSDGKGFSPLEPLQNWIDLFVSGVKPRQVTLLGMNGGRIAAFEYRLALMLGAQVGLIESSGRAASELASDPDWRSSERLVYLPLDSMTIRAFVHPVDSRLNDDQLERAGRVVHENYLHENSQKKMEPSLLPWDELREDFKNSNRHQAAYAEVILRHAGYGVREAAEEVVLPRFTRDEVERMAEMEHGRWNAERLKSGWRYGTVRDTENKITPYLVPWAKLPEGIRKYDRDAVLNYAAVLKGAGLEVYKLD